MTSSNTPASADHALHALITDSMARFTSAMVASAGGAIPVEVRENRMENASWRHSALTLVAAVACAGVVMDARAQHMPSPKDHAFQAYAQAQVEKVNQAEERVVIKAGTPTVFEAPPAAAGRRGNIPSVSEAVSATAASGARTLETGLPAVVVEISGVKIETLHPIDRVRLCKEVAQQEKLSAVGSDWTDLYAVVQAETAWAARDGWSKSGRVNRGLAQLEDATSHLLGVSNPDDPRQALTATARLVKEARQWARAKGHADGANSQAAISVYYNLSTAGRNAWDSTSLQGLPIETRRHVANYLSGKQTAQAVGRQYERFTTAVARAVKHNMIAADLLAQLQPSIRIQRHSGDHSSAIPQRIGTESIGNAAVHAATATFPNAQHPTHVDADYVKEPGLGLRLRVALERAVQRADEVRETAQDVVEEVREVMRMRS